MSTVTSAAEATSTVNTRTPDDLESCTDEYFEQVRDFCPCSSDIERAKAAFRSCKPNPDTVEARWIHDVKDRGDVIYKVGRKMIVIVAPKGSTGPETAKTVMKLHKVSSTADRFNSKQLYQELLIHMYVQKREAELRKDKPNRLIAACKPYWYTFSSCRGFELEYFPEGTLQELSCDRVQDGERLRLLRDAARGLHFLNRLGIVHFDVKPSNICVVVGAGDARSTKLIDLGSAKFTGQMVDRRRKLGDTRAYRPPEFFPTTPGAGNGDGGTENWVAVSPSADSWRFGMCVLEVMTRTSRPLWKRAEAGDRAYDAFMMNGGLLGKYPPTFPGLCTSKQQEFAILLIFSLLQHRAAGRMTMEEVIRELSEHSVGKAESPPDAADTAGQPVRYCEI
eukprot:scpid62662/ scgid9741/ 